VLDGCNLYLCPPAIVNPFTKFKHLLRGSRARPSSLRLEPPILFQAKPPRSPPPLDMKCYNLTNGQKTDSRRQADTTTCGKHAQP